MNILAIDDEVYALEALKDAICEAAPEAEVFTFDSIKKVLEFTRDNVCDVAFLDIRLRGMSGLELALELKKTWPRVNIIFATGYDEYLFAAVKQRCSGYLLKPIKSSQVREELENLRIPLALVRKPIHAQTFGNFELFVNDMAVEFDSTRSKELLAFLIDRRGAAMTNAGIAAVIWENNMNTLSVQTQFRKAKASLLAALKTVGAQDIIKENRKELSVDMTQMSCDYWQMLEGDVAALNSFSGEYMTGYSWAEITLASLWQRK